MLDSVVEFIQVYGIDDLKKMSPATRGLKYLRYCQETLKVEPVSVGEFHAFMDGALA